MQKYILQILKILYPRKDIKLTIQHTSHFYSSFRNKESTKNSVESKLNMNSFDKYREARKKLKADDSR